MPLLGIIMLGMGITISLGDFDGHNEDKGTNFGLKFATAEKVNVSILTDAIVNFECRFVTEYRPGNCPSIIGEVAAGHVNIDEEVRRFANLGKGYQYSLF